MSPVARIVLTFYTAFPVQRVLLALVAVGCAVAMGFALFAGNPPSGSAGYASRWLAAGAAAATLFGAFVTFPTFMAFGVVFGALSAPRTFLLLPHFRRRMLAAVAIAFAAGIASVLALVSFSQEPWLAIPVAGYVFGLFTFAALYNALPPVWVLLAAVSCAPVLHFVSSLGGRAGALLVPAALAAAAAVAWAVFARSYLRGNTPTLKLPSLTDLLSGNVRPPSGKAGAWQRWSVDDSDTALERSKLRIVLFGRLPVRPLRQLASLALFAAIVALWLPLVLRLTSGPADAPWFLMPFVFAPSLWNVAASSARRARMLWLLGPQRVELFRLVEKAVMRQVLSLSGGAALLTFALALWNGGLPPRSAALVAAALPAYALLAAYLGLLFVRGFGAIETVLAIAAASAFLYTLICALAPAEHGSELLTWTFAALGAAVACRYAALHLWRSIDWIRLRPPRGASQRLRSAGA